MEAFAAVVDTKGLIGLIAGILILIVIGNLILGGDEPRHRRMRRQTAGLGGDPDDEGWDDAEGDYPEADQPEAMDVLTATRALIVPDAYEGRHLYVELGDGEVVHLFGRWLEDYHVGEPRATFPCESFRPYADWEDPFDLEHPYRVECLGPPLEPLVALEPLSLEARRARLAPADWDRIPMSFDRLLRHIGPTARVGMRRSAAAPDPLEALWEAEPVSPGRHGPASPGRTSASPLETDAAVTGQAPPLSGEPIFSTSRDLDVPDELEPATPDPGDAETDVAPGAEEVPPDAREG